MTHLVRFASYVLKLECPVTKLARVASLFVCGVLLFSSGAMALHAQDSGSALRVTRLGTSSTTLVVKSGESAPLTITAYDANGGVVETPIRMTGARDGVRIEDGLVFGLAAGEYEIFASLALPTDAGRAPLQITIPVTVEWPSISRVEIASTHAQVFPGTTMLHTVTAFHADGTRRPGPEVRWSSGTTSVATVDRYGYVTGVSEGSVTITASVEDVSANVAYTIVSFPAASLEIVGGLEEIRTGDVQEFELQATGPSGQTLSDIPVTWTLAFRGAEGIIAPSAPGQIDEGRMVADVPGIYTVMASAGGLSTTRRFTVTQRDVVQQVNVVGQGRQTTHYTSDLWIFEGVDGRDYALTGARQAQSHAFVWDVTNPANIFKTDSIQVDARSLNDVKTSPDGRYGVISREGASSRRNGIVILDLANPAHPTIASVYDEGLTGGVHNVFAMDDYLFALSGGDKYIILDVRDINNPTYVSEYDHPNSRIHDVWVKDGIAYSAEWGTGIVMVDVGNGRWGGSIERPKLITSYKLPSDATHAVFPYTSQSTGKQLLFVGDEITNRRGKAWQGNGPDVRMAFDPETGRGGYPRVTSGYIQVLDLTDPENPEMIARYEVTEFGTHNIWVEDDILYQAYYEGGMRLVDVSGELMGNLYTQGREIAVHKANDPQAWIANAPAAWGVIPYKGHVFFSDISSGLWSVKLEPKGRPVS